MPERPSGMPFDKHPRQLVREERWFNSGPPADLLRCHPVTPTELFFTRNHGAVPDIDAGTYRLEITGGVAQPMALSLDQLQRDYPAASVVATISCAGLRREELNAVRPLPGEVPWGTEPISTGVWTGARLADVLAGARPLAGATYAAFTGLDEVQRHGERFGFGGSIPLAKALAGETLLAYQLNGAPLPPVHGFPLRALVPGYVGARSVKWLTRITLQAEPSDNYFQAKAYRVFAPTVDADNVVWERGVPLADTPLNSVIWSPEPEALLTAGAIQVSGWACANGGRTIERVELSWDGGATWHQAALQADRTAWAWCLWDVQVQLPVGHHTLMVRAWDSDGNSQPEDPAALWNFKGYANNAWHRVPVRVAAGRPA